MVRSGFTAFSALLLVFAPVSTVIAKTKADAGFSFPKDAPVRIILLRPDVEVASLGAGGVPTPNADWTADARKQIESALIKSQVGRGIAITPMAELSGEDAATVQEYQSLFRAVGSSVMVHSYALKLPSKKQADGKYRFDWTLGPGANRIATLGGGDYGLFVYGYDAYATAGRKTMQIFMLLASAALGGGFFPQGGQHFSYASLVDLRSGKIVWFNFYADKKGDIRTVEGAQIRADKLLSTLPLREGEKPVKKKVAKKA